MSKYILFKFDRRLNVNIKIIFSIFKPQFVYYSSYECFLSQGNVKLGEGLFNAIRTFWSIFGVMFKYSQIISDENQLQFQFIAISKSDYKKM